jgi:hypothetical protein
MAFGRKFFTSRSAPVLPLTGLSRRLTGLCPASEKVLAFESDEFGFRNAVGSHSGAEVVIVGDSFAQGYCVSDSASVAGIIRGHFPSTLNLGVTGAGPLWELAVLREYGASVRPQRIVWLFFEGNDLESLPVEAGGFLSRYLDQSYTQDLRSRQSLVDSLQYSRLDSLADALLLPGAERFRRTILLKEIRARLGINFRPSEAAVPEAGSSVTRELAILQTVLESARETASAWGGRILFVYLPERSRFTNSDSTTAAVDERQRARQMVIDVARKARLDVLDIVPVFAAERAPAGLWDEARIHYNARGYRVAAEAIVDELTRLDGAGKVAGKNNPQRQQNRAAEDYWIEIEPVKLSMVRRATRDR